MINKTFLTALILSAVSFIPLQGRVEAAEFRSGVEVLIGADEILNEDVYAVAGRVIVDGTINGDLVAAGENIQVNGAVNGDLIVSARSITINGAVEDDIRAAGATLQFRSLVGGDLITAGDQITIEADSVVGEDLVARANTVIANGDVEGNLDLDVVNATIAGTVQGNVDAVVEEELTLSPEATIGGALNYTSVNEVTLPPGAQVVGAVTMQAPTISIFGFEFQVSALISVLSQILEQIKWFIGTVLAGLILIWLFPRAMHTVTTTLPKSPWKSLFMGALALPLIPIILLLILIVAMSTLEFSVFPIVAVPTMAYGSLLLIAKPAIAMAIGYYVGKHVMKRGNLTLRGALVIGAALLAVTGLIPYVDSIVGWLTLFLGVGIWLLFFYRHYRNSPVTQSV